MTIKDTIKQNEEEFENLDIFCIEDNEFSWVGRSVIDYSRVKNFINQSNIKLLEAVEEEINNLYLPDTSGNVMQNEILDIIRKAKLK